MAGHSGPGMGGSANFRSPVCADRASKVRDVPIEIPLPRPPRRNLPPPLGEGEGGSRSVLVWPVVKPARNAMMGYTEGY